ncbi:MAG TPA: Gfo/Idh/MocA family oxidoreductase [Gaiellaceae bacterium]|nr:Gfo/Idh/MocA family oxidoreductase [Gaiellaceae bacterium]
MVRLGLLSTARINREILRASAGSQRVDVVAVASRDRARAEAHAREHGIATAHASYEALLDDPGVDAVYVPLPNGLHHEWTMRALAAGKHVLCEKPYSRRPAEVEEAFDLAERSGLVLMEAFMYRHHPQIRSLEDLVSRGILGRLRAIRAVMRFRLEDAGDVRLRPDLDGGALMDVGCYCVSGARLVGGEPVSVLGEQLLGPSGVDVAFQGILRFPDDVLAQFECSFLAPRRQELEVIGDEATLLLDAPFRRDWGGRVLVRRGDAVEEIEVAEGDSYALQLENLADAVAGRAEPRLGRDDALGQARAIDALYRAAEAGSSVTL